MSGMDRVRERTALAGKEKLTITKNSLTIGYLLLIF
jgi:hypothetical protein